MPTTASAPIEIEGLSKRFGPTVALDGLDMVVRRGEIHGFLGPNGAGKTTTLRVLLGLLKADGGTASLLGGDPWRDATDLHRRLAYVPGDVNLWPTLTGGEVIDLLGRLRGGLDETRRAVLLERFDLDPTKKTRAYSKGNRQKVALIAALSSRVELLLLDEPTAGLDPLMEAAFRETVAELNDNGDVTILLASHILSEVEALCDRVSIIREGTIVESGTLPELRHLTRTSIDAVLDQPLVTSHEISGAHDVVVDGHRFQCQVDADDLAGVLRQLADRGIRSITAQPPTLEELFLRHYRSRAPAGDGRPA